MINQEADGELFETLLRLAVTQNHINEMALIPSENELSNYYSFSSQFNKKIHRLIRKEKYTNAIRFLNKYLVTTAVALAIILVLTFCRIMMVQEVRATVVNVIIEWFDNNTDFRFTNQMVPQESNVLCRPSYIPYNFYEQSVERTGQITTVIYINADKQSIYFIYSPAQAGYSFGVDNDNSYYSLVSINGVDAHLFKAKSKKDSNHLIWQDSDTSFSLISTINYTELIKMAKTIAKK